MFSLSPIKIMVIVAVVLVLLGPDKLPEVAHKLGNAWRQFKRFQERIENEVREVVPDLPSASEIARIARSPVNLLNQLADRAEERETDAETPTGSLHSDVNDVAPMGEGGLPDPAVEEDVELADATPLREPPTSADPSLN